MAVRLTSPTISHMSGFETDINSEMESCLFLKTIIPTAMATVLNQRIQFESTYVKNRTIEGVPYIGFRSTIPKTHCVYKLFASSNMFQELIERKHLKEVCILIQDLDTPKIHEEYVFSFKYENSDSDSCNKQSSKKLAELAAKFFKNINMIPNDVKYSEELIQILFGCKFYENMPNDVLTKNFKPAKKSTCSPLLYISSLMTNFYKVQLMYGCPSERQPEIEEFCTAVSDQADQKDQSVSQSEQFVVLSNNSIQVEQNNRVDGVDDLAQSQEFANLSAHSNRNEQNSQIYDATQSEEFANLSENIQNQLFQPITPKKRKALPPIRVRTPKPSSAFVKKMKQMLVEGLEPLYPLEKKRKSYKSPAYTSTSSDLLSDDKSDN